MISPEILSPDFIGSCFRALIRADGRSHREIASAAGLSPPHLSDVLAGKRAPRMLTVIKLKNALNLSWGDFDSALHKQNSVPKNVNQAISYVYFIQSGKSGPIKIGFTKKNPQSRLKTLQGASSEPLRILATMNCSGAPEESAIHKRFHHLRIRGEWFRPGRDLLDFIDQKAEVFALGEDHA